MATGTAVVDFGAAPGKIDAEVAVAGQAGILAASSLAEAWMHPIANADRSADEHLALMELIDVVAYNIVDATGFTIRAHARNGYLTGKVSLWWAWS